MQKRKLVHGNLLQMMKMYENFKFAIQRLRVTFCIEDMGDPSAVLRYINAGIILVLLQSSIILYTLTHINEIVVPKSIKAFNHFPAWTITMGQSEKYPIVSWWSDDHPPHSFEPSSLLERGPSNLKDQSLVCFLVRVWLWVLNGDLLMMKSMKGCFLWMWLWCFPCI